MNYRIPINRALQRIGLGVHRWPPPNSLQKDLQKLLKLLDADAVLDVGANRGQFARSLREIGFRGQILSFEPNPDVFSTLNASAGSDPRWHVFPYALGSADGALTLHIPVGDDLASTLTLNEFARDSFGGVVDPVQDISVPVYRLDTMLASLMAEFGFDRPFLKLDTQGFDLHALEGARGVWPVLVGLLTEVSFKPLYTEMPDVTESLEKIREAGFDVTGMFPVVRDRTEAVIEMDCLARRHV